LDGISAAGENPRPMPRTNEAAYAALVATTALWSGNTITGRALAESIPPAAFSFWRWVLVLAVLAPFVAPALLRDREALRRDWRALAVLGLMSTGLYHALVFWVLHYTTAINAQLLNSTIPLWVMLIGWAAFGLRPGGREWAGFAVSGTGVLAIIAHGDWRRLAALELNVGDLMMLAAMMVWSIYTVLLSRWGVRVSGFTFVFVTGAFGLAGLAPFYLWELASGRGTFALSPATLGGIVYTALGASILATILFNRGLARVGASRAALFTHLVPVFGVLFGVLLLGERLGLHHLAGFALILTGIALTNARVSGRLRGTG
jgi:drug/metabolite transporter (DMT)-like permease